jgi:hypothetical protein
LCVEIAAETRRQERGAFMKPTWCLLSVTTDGEQGDFGFDAA